MPTKIIVTHQGAMRKKYGSRWPKIKSAVRKLIAADKRSGITSLFVALDDPKFGAQRARAGTPATFKAAIDYAYGIHRKPDYIAILGGPDIVPLQNMPPSGVDSSVIFRPGPVFRPVLTFRLKADATESISNQPSALHS